MRYICSLLFFCFLLCGCSREATEKATRPLPGQGGKKQFEQVPFVAYVEDTDDGGTQAVVHYPAEDRKRVIGTSAICNRRAPSGVTDATAAQAAESVVGWSARRAAGALSAAPAYRYSSLAAGISPSLAHL